VVGPPTTGEDTASTCKAQVSHCSSRLIILIIHWGSWLLTSLKQKVSFHFIPLCGKASCKKIWKIWQSLLLF